MRASKKAGLSSIIITTVLISFALLMMAHKPATKTPPAYCHACPCGREAAKCINECNSPKMCTIMCADKCNTKKMANSKTGGSPELQQEFEDTNARFFGGALPATAVYLSNQVEDDWIGETTKDPNGVFDIEIDEPLAPAVREQEWVLRHEMCHVATWGEKETAHGAAWQECMVTLANKGAFTNVW